MRKHIQGSSLLITYINHKTLYMGCLESVEWNGYCNGLGQDICTCIIMIYSIIWVMLIGT